MNYLNLGSTSLAAAIEWLEKSKDNKVDQIISNLKEEENNLDTIIMNIEDEND